jgi:hypothetical protein
MFCGVLLDLQRSLQTVVTLFNLSQRRQFVYSTEPQNYYRNASVRIKTVISGKTGHRKAKSNRVLLQLGISIKNK